MEKEKFISKFNIKDYNNQLEKILSKKTFSENTKNLLLNVLYKVENAYEDYKLVTQDTRTKKEILEEIVNIIEKDCETIEIINEKTSSSNIKEKKIITYLNAKKILYEIYQIKSHKFKILPTHKMIKSPLEKTLNQGYSIASNEIIRDFDGWTWNIEVEEIENLKANFVYQTLRLLVGTDFLKEWQENGEEDYITKVKDILQDKYGTGLGENLFNVITQIAMINVAESDIKERDKLIKIQEYLQEEYNKLHNKREYLDNIGTDKKQIVKKVKRIDEIMNNDRKLKEEFIIRNEKLDMDHRVFSLSDFAEILEEEREKLINKLNVYNKIMEPLVFVEMRTVVEDSLKLIKEIDLQNLNEKIYNAKIKELGKLVCKAMELQIDNTQDKENIKRIIYQIRYYTSIYVNKDEQLKDIINTNDIQRAVITKACKQRYITIFSPDIKQNYEITKNIFQTDIIELEKIYFKFNQNEDMIILNIYDEENIYKTIQCKEITELNVKLNKKIKVFI